jgi:hypothetical protein
MALYSFQKGDLKEINAGTFSDFKMHVIQVPVFFGFHVLGPLSIEAAPVFNYNLSMTRNFSGNMVEIGKAGFGYRVGAALDLGLVIFNTSFETVAFRRDDITLFLKEPGKIIFGAAIRLAGNRIVPGSKLH